MLCHFAELARRLHSLIGTTAIWPSHTSVSFMFVRHAATTSTFQQAHELVHVRRHRIMQQGCAAGQVLRLRACSSCSSCSSSAAYFAVKGLSRAFVIVYVAW